MSGKARVLDNLFRRAGGICHWCGRETVRWRGPEGVYPKGHPARRTPPNAATIDHLRDRFDPTRGEPARNQERRHVLACSECNNRRNRERLDSLPKEVIWARSHQQPGRLESLIARRAGGAR